MPLDEIETFCNGLDHAEGITITRGGTIYVGGEAGQLYRVEADGSPTEAHSTDEFLLGLACDADDAVYAIDATGRCVWRIDPTPARGSASSRAPRSPARQPNWGAFDEAGNYYLSDSGHWGARDA